MKKSIVILLLLFATVAYAGSGKYRAHGAGQSKRPQTTIFEQMQFNHWLRHMYDRPESKAIDYQAYPQTPPSLVKPKIKLIDSIDKIYYHRPHAQR